MLVIFAGLPGTGKTTLAHELARRLDAVYLRIDRIERALAESDLKLHPAEDAGYQVGYVLAEDNLRLGRTVIADSVNPIAPTRDAWLRAAARAGRAGIEVEVICSDPAEHRRRVEERRSDIAGLKPPDWRSVAGRDYRPWERDRIVIDTAGRSVEQSLDELLGRLPSPAAD